MLCIEQYIPKENRNIIERIKEFFQYIIIEEKNIILHANKSQKLYIIKIKNKKKSIKKLENKLKKINETKAILEKKLKNSEIEKVLIKNDIEIIEGKRIFLKLLEEEILKYIVRIQKRKINELKIVIITNEDTTYNKKLIEEISKKVKSLIIYTNRIEKFKKIENDLNEKFGINITVTNNSNIIEKSELYINLDFDKENFEKLKINRNGIIINTFYKFTYENKKFNGINILDYEIKFPVEKSNIKEILKKYENKTIIESLFWNEKYKNKKKLKIDYLIGKNGKLMSNEFYKVFFENNKNGRKQKNEKSA